MCVWVFHIMTLWVNWLHMSVQECVIPSKCLPENLIGNRSWRWCSLSTHFDRCMNENSKWPSRIAFYLYTAPRSLLTWVLWVVWLQFQALCPQLFQNLFKHLQFICTRRPQGILWESKNWRRPKHMHKASEILPVLMSMVSWTAPKNASESLSWLRYRELFSLKKKKHSLQHDKNPQQKLENIWHLLGLKGTVTSLSTTNLPLIARCKLRLFFIDFWWW